MTSDEFQAGWLAASIAACTVLAEMRAEIRARKASGSKTIETFRSGEHTALLVASQRLAELGSKGPDGGAA